MKRNNFIIAAFLVLSATLFAQDMKLHFRVISADSTSVNRINVVNLTNEKSATTAFNGDFIIAAKTGDVLFLQKETFEYRHYTVQPDDLQKSEILITMVSKPIQLEEVIITQRAIPDDLLKMHKDHKKFTPAERKLYTAKAGVLDPLVNWMSGRTTMLKKEVDVELKERLLARLEITFEDSFYTDQLGIPEAYVGDFKRYLIDDEAFVMQLRAKNKPLMKFEAAKLATSYKQLMSSVFK
ncbi:MAG: hypothetical protein EOO48_00515 [Flavobacterium sp.]|nr:MAG: hypothetical protein EOO48_00515 [Flavobacterium sp.]